MINMGYKEIAGLTTTGMALSTAANAFPSFGRKKKKRKGLAQTGVESIVGLALTRETAALVGAL